MKRLWTRALPLVLAIATSAALAVSPAEAQNAIPKTPIYKHKVLFNFTDVPMGLGPRGGLVRDAAGNLYGTTYTGGIVSQQCPITNNECGVVYKLDTHGNETILHDFTGGSDGGGPWGNLIMDTQGNLYGTTSTGGNSSCLCGVVYKMDSQGNETVLYAFTDSQEGFGPGAGLLMDQAGNLYGTTATGGSYGQGSIFKIDANGNYSVLHSFAAWDGELLFYSPLVMGTAGNLYGVASYGGALGAGTVFKLDLSTGRLTMLYNFTLSYDGGFPTGPIALDSAGNIYGATYEGGNGSGYGPGVAFKLETSGRYSVLYAFSGSGSSGSYGGGVVRGQDGNMYGTTAWDGPSNAGNVFRITLAGQVVILYNFKGGTDGAGVWASVTADPVGNIYGTTESGGTTGGGTVFELSPN